MNATGEKTSSPPTDQGNFARYSSQCFGPMKPSQAGRVGSFAEDAIWLGAKLGALPAWLRTGFSHSSEHEPCIKDEFMQ